MFTLVTCPTCQHKFTVPEAAMGKRQSCPSCQSPFLAGKSVGEADVPMRYAPAPVAAMNKTMLGETAPPITYNCPRCKKALESPASEAGTKKPCPACGGRLQVPAAPAPPPQANLNKTILASDESKLPTSLIAGVPVPAPAYGAPPAGQPVGAAPTGKALKLTPKMYIIGGSVAGVICLLLLTCLIFALVSGPSAADREKYKKSQEDLANYKKEIEEIKRGIKEKEDRLAKQQDLERQYKRDMDELLAKAKERQTTLDYQRELDRLNNKNDEAKAAQAKRIFDEQQRKIDADKKDALQKEFEFRAKMATLESQLAAEKQRATTIIQQPPPPVYYPPPWYHYGRWGW